MLLTSEHDHHQIQAVEDALPFIGSHKHVCCFYRTQTEMEALWVPFVATGIQQQHKCVVLVGTDYTEDDAMHALTSARPDLASALRSGSLTIVNNDGFPTSTNTSAKDIIAFWKDRIVAACSEGFGSLRVVAQMTWLADAQREMDFVPEYELLCNRLYGEFPFSALCMYDTRIFSQFQIDRVTSTHPYVGKYDPSANTAKLSSPRDFLLQNAGAMEKQSSSQNSILYKTAASLLEQECYAEAEDLFRRIVESDTGLSKVTAMLGLVEALRRQGRNAEAGKVEDQATDLLLKR